MTRLRVLHVVGARPNFMKVAPVMTALGELGVEQTLVHTGQHYDKSMSELFFQELGLPRPDINLGVGPGSHGKQTGRIMSAFEPVVQQKRPNLVLVVGDVNSTLACAIDAKKLGIPVAHVEAGLRSGDLTMPEEINRIVTDSIADLLFTTDKIAQGNLLSQGVAEEKLFLVGNVMIDTLLRHRERALARPAVVDVGIRSEENRPPRYVVTTLHRPGNVDNPRRLREIVSALCSIAGETQVVIPAHPRTKKRLEENGLIQPLKRQGVQVIDPLGYLDLLKLNCGAQVVITDSGGIQEETTILGVPCLTVRDNTERPITVEQGTNRLVSATAEALFSAYRDAISEKAGKKTMPALWDGRTAERIADVIARWGEDKVTPGRIASGRP